MADVNDMEVRREALSGGNAELLYLTSIYLYNILASLDLFN